MRCEDAVRLLTYDARRRGLQWSGREVAQLCLTLRINGGRGGATNWAIWLGGRRSGLTGTYILAAGVCRVENTLGLRVAEV